MRIINLAMFMAMTVLTACCDTGRDTPNTTDAAQNGNGVYYWKTVFELNNTERDFLKEHQVKRLYLRFFDVVPADNGAQHDYVIVPNATITFKEAMPEGVEIVPVVYITLDALRLINSPNHDYAEEITQRVLNMADFNDLGNIREIQLDCDWTQQTQEGYFAFCQAMKDELMPLGIQLSCTIRLWQLACDCPPVDRGVLMLYNTGTITNPNTNNSILDIEDVKTYLKGEAYNLPLSLAYPTFSWYVWFRNDTYMGLFHDQPGTEIEAGDVIRYEQVSFEELQQLDSLVRLKMPGADHASIILYHLDSANLSNYTTDEIRQIYSRD